MPYKSIAAAKKGNFPTTIAGAHLSLAQVNWLARTYDHIKAAGSADEPMAVAMTTFKQKYKKKGNKWMAKADEQELAGDFALADLLEHHGVNHNSSHSNKFKLPVSLTAHGSRKSRPSYESVGRMIRDAIDGKEGELPVVEMEGIRGGFAGSFEERIKGLRNAVKNHSLFAHYSNGKEGYVSCPVDVIATFENSAYLYDWRAEKYYSVEYEMDSNDEPMLTSIEEAKPELVIKEQADDVRHFLRSRLIEATDEEMPGLMRLVGDLADCEMLAEAGTREGALKGWGKFRSGASGGSSGGSGGGAAGGAGGGGGGGGGRGGSGSGGSGKAGRSWLDKDNEVEWDAESSGFGKEYVKGKKGDYRESGPTQDDEKAAESFWEKYDVKRERAGFAGSGTEVYTNRSTGEAFRVTKRPSGKGFYGTHHAISKVKAAVNAA